MQRGAEGCRGGAGGCIPCARGGGWGVSKTKHILQAAEYLCDLVLRHIFVLRHIPGVSNPADVMTKALPRGTFLKVIELIFNFTEVMQAAGGAT